MLRTRLLPLLAALLAAPGLAPAQRDTEAPKKPKQRLVDPYTKNEAAALKKLGYVGFGPFTFGDRHDTGDIEHVLGLENQILWVETAHFKIGVRLGTYKIPRDNKDERKRLREELARLAKKLPGLRPRRVTALEPWLRLHLYAQRAEELYADLSARLGVTDASFPGPDGKGAHTEYMGKGPYFGQPNKFTILLLSKASVLANYCKTFQKQTITNDCRFNDAPAGTLFFGGAVEFAKGDFRSDTGLHCSMVYNVTHNLVDGYRYYWYSLPNWFREGLAHWYTRRVDPHFVRAVGKTTYELDPERRWNWAPRVRARAKFDEFPKAETLCRIHKLGVIEFMEHVMSWSRVDYLMSLGDAGFRKYLHHMKGIPVISALPTTEQILARQDEALRAAWGLDMATFDARWKAWVLKTYPKK